MKINLCELPATYLLVDLFQDSALKKREVFPEIQKDPDFLTFCAEKIQELRTLDEFYKGFFSGGVKFSL